MSEQTVLICGAGIAGGHADPGQELAPLRRADLAGRRPGGAPVVGARQDHVEPGLPRRVDPPPARVEGRNSARHLHVVRTRHRDELLAACDEYFARTGREITLEYILLRDVNDRPEHARELARLAACSSFTSCGNWATRIS